METMALPILGMREHIVYVYQHGVDDARGNVLVNLSASHITATKPVAVIPLVQDRKSNSRDE